MLYKFVAIALSALFIVTVQMSAASAGGCGHRGFHAFQASLAHQQAVKQSRARKAAQVAAAKQKKAAQVAAAKQRKAQQVARAEKAEASKVATAEPAPVKEETKIAAESTEAKVDVASVEQTCTRFFAETGTTVTVECSKQ